jgi:N-acetylglucosaminyldiphosphoundecaprenol N-acetyl-beta-D-mannosaminyltransferase
VAIQRLKNQYPSLEVVGYSPPFHHLLEMNHDEIKRRIAEAKPDMLFVSFGCPKQEKWIAMHYRTLGVPVTIGVGATIDFLAGQVRRAPVWMQHTGTEWIFRLAQEPRRLFRRYWTDLWSFGGSLCLQWWQLKGHSGRDGHGGSASGPEVGRQCGLFPSADIGVRSQRVCLPERFDVAAVCDYGRQVEQRLAADCHCLLDMSGVSFIDSTGVGFLIRLQKRIRADGWQLILLNPGTEVRRALSVLGLENFFLSADDLATARELIEAQQYSPSVALVRAGVENTVTWHGEITAANTEHIWSETANLLAAASGASWSIDMAQVSFIDSSGLGLMIRVKKFANYVVMFKNVHPAVRNVVRIAGLEQFLLDAPGQGDGLNRQNARQTSRQLTSDGPRSKPRTSTAKL